MSTPLGLLKEQLEKYNGVARMNPLWICAARYAPGRRLKVHPDTMYPFGTKRGPVCERWFCSVGINDKNGVVNESTVSHFGLDGRQEISFPEAIAAMGKELLGEDTMNRAGTFDMFARLYDYNVSVFPLHLHYDQAYAGRVRKTRKVEAAFFPAEMNNSMSGNETTYVGLLPNVTKEQFREYAGKSGTPGDIRSLCQAYQIESGTGWVIPAGVLHAPAGAVTYEPQSVNEVLTIWQNGGSDRPAAGQSDLSSFAPDHYRKDPVEYLFEVLDWEENFGNQQEKALIRPIPVRNPQDMHADGYHEDWIVYNSEEFSCKRLTVMPNQKVVIKDAAAYGFVVMNGYGRINEMRISSPSVIRAGEELTEDEGFVTKDAAYNGVVIENESNFQELVLYKHFGSDNARYKGQEA